MYEEEHGTADRIIRAIIAIAIIVLYFAGQITGTAAAVLDILTVLLLATSITGVCPGYWPFGISTLKKTRETQLFLSVTYRCYKKH
jgi:hypothetical protein